MAIAPIVIDASDLKRQAAAFRKGPQAVQAALVRAMNRGGDAGYVAVRNQVVKQTGISAKDTRRSKGLAKKMATQRDQTYEVVARSKWTPLSYFNPVQTPGGVRANPWNRQQVFPRTFMVTMRSGFTGVFARDPNAPRQTFTTRGGKVKSRPKLKQLWGPSLAVEVGRGEVPRLFDARAREVIAQRLPHELDFALGKIMARPRKGR